MPNAARAVLLEPEGRSQKGALAISVANGLDLQRLRKILTDAVKFGSLSDNVKFAVAPSAGRTLLLMGLNVDPKTVFDPGATEEALPTLVQLDGNLVALANVPLDFEHAFSRTLGTSGSLSFRSWRSGRAFVSEFAAGSATVVEAPGWLEQAGALVWDSPIRDHEPPSPGSKCLTDAARELGLGFRTLAMEDRESTGPLALTLVDRIAPSLACASQDPVTRPRALALQQHLLAPIVRLLEKGWRKEYLSDLLETLCKGTNDAALCTDLEHVNATPPYNLPRLSDEELTCPVYVRSDEHDPWAGPSGSANSRIQVTDDGSIYLNGHVTTTSKLVPALNKVAERLSDDFNEEYLRNYGIPALYSARGSVDLGVAATAKYHHVKPVLEAITRSDLARCNIIVTDTTGEPRRIQTRSRSKTSEEVTFVYKLDRGQAQVHAEGIHAKGTFKIADTQGLRTRIHAKAPNANTVVEPSDATPWSDVALALATACPNARIK